MMAFCTVFESVSSTTRSNGFSCTSSRFPERRRLITRNAYTTIGRKIFSRIGTARTNISFHTSCIGGCSSVVCPERCGNLASGHRGGPQPSTLAVPVERNARLGHFFCFCGHAFFDGRIFLPKTVPANPGPVDCYATHLCRWPLPFAPCPLS